MGEPAGRERQGPWRGSERIGAFWGNATCGQAATHLRPPFNELQCDAVVALPVVRQRDKPKGAPLQVPDLLGGGQAGQGGAQQRGPAGHSGAARWVAEQWAGGAAAAAGRGMPGRAPPVHKHLYFLPLTLS